MVMLHGCKQNPEDFAAGTRMNEFARDQGFFVLYPAQSAMANPARCWNWYAVDNLKPGQGEAGLIMALIDEVLDHYPIDAGRVFVAGLSAGGGMSADLVRTYPDRFAGVGIHSGVPAGVAHDMLSAFAVMRGRAPRRPRSRPPTPDAIDADYLTGPGPGVPTIVFHGDEDKVSSPVNAERIIVDTLGSFANAVGARNARLSLGARPPVQGSDQPQSNSQSKSQSQAQSRSQPEPQQRSRSKPQAKGDQHVDGDDSVAIPSLPAEIDKGETAGGRTWTRTVFTDDDGRPIAEQWALHGFGHAWSGGSPAGSYTDDTGPDATREMLRFFREATSRPPSARSRLPLFPRRGRSGWRVVSRA